LPVTTETLINHLKAKEAKEGKLPELLEFYLSLLHVQHGVEQRLSPLLEPGLDEDTAKLRISQGFPLLRFDELTLDKPLLMDTSKQVTAVFLAHAELFENSLENISVSNVDTADIIKAAEAWYRGERLPADFPAKDIDEDLKADLVHATFKPFLVSHATPLSHNIDQESWRRGYCPVCGGSPDFAFIEKEIGERWLICYRCDTEWAFQRLECPYCGNHDQKSLAYFTDEGLYRLYVCDKCGNYLKAIDLRQAAIDVFMPLQRLYTFDMDKQALEKGYHPGNGAVDIL